MPPIETQLARVSNREEDAANNEPSMSGKSIVGLINPPPEIRAICEKTAIFVARNGIDFENRIKEKEQGNPRFNFMSPTSAYFAFYRAKVAEHETGVAVESTQPRPRLPEAVREHVQAAEFVPTAPPPPFEYMADPATLNAFDLDLMRLTAMFVARNGRTFMTNLMMRENRNHQFDFLKPQHSNFPYFTKLVEQYTKVIIPPKSIIDDLTKGLDYDFTLGDVKYRVAWEKHQRVIKDREDKALEQERMAYNSIDWHDFHVAQTVDFQLSETLNLPPLCTPKDVGSRILQQQRTEAAKAAAESEAMDVDSDSEEEVQAAPAATAAAAASAGGRAERTEQRAAYEVTQPTPAPPTVDSALVRDYDPRKARQQPAKPTPESYIISPLTNERIPADKLQDHVRYNTVDPQYKEQRDREQLDRQDDDLITNASGTEIARNIGRFADRRSDIFGVGAQGAEQTQIGRKLGEEGRSNQPLAELRGGNWAPPPAAPKPPVAQSMPPPDLPPPSVPPAAAIPPPPVDIVIPTPPPQRAPPMPPMPMHRQPMPPMGMMPPMGLPPHPGMPPQGLPPPQGMYAPPPNPYDMYGGGDAAMYGGDEPSQKKARFEDALQPEDAWLRRVSGPIQLGITTPIAAEWNLEGAPFQLRLDITSTVAALKTDIQEKTTVPTSKQKLCYENMYLKDTNSLAFYNMRDGSTIQLQLKERGGRKK